MRWIITVINAPQFSCCWMKLSLRPSGTANKSINWLVFPFCQLEIIQLFSQFIHSCNMRLSFGVLDNFIRDRSELGLLCVFTGYRRHWILSCIWYFSKTCTSTFGVFFVLLGLLLPLDAIMTSFRFFFCSSTQIGSEFRWSQYFTYKRLTVV